MSAKCRVGHKPLMYSDTDTSIPNFSKDNILPFKENKNNFISNNFCTNSLEKIKFFMVHGIHLCMYFHYILGAGERNSTFALMIQCSARN